MDEVLLFTYYIFILQSLILGSILGFYHKIWWFDLLCHFISGCLTVIVAFVVLQKNHLVHINYKWFGILFITIFTISIAAIWEYFEFTIDKIGGTDTQYVTDTGVSDTMEDMLIATLPGVVGSVYYLKYLNRSKEGK